MLNFTQLSVKHVHPGDLVAVYNARKNAPTWKRVRKVFTDAPWDGQVTLWLDDGRSLQYPEDAKVGVKGHR